MATVEVLAHLFQDLDSNDAQNVRNADTRLSAFFSSPEGSSAIISDQVSFKYAYCRLITHLFYSFAPLSLRV